MEFGSRPNTAVGARHGCGADSSVLGFRVRVGMGNTIAARCAAMNRRLVSKQPVADHGEVFTGQRELNAMLDRVQQKTRRIDSRFLEPAGGTGNSPCRVALFGDLPACDVVRVGLVKGRVTYRPPAQNCRWAKLSPSGRHSSKLAGGRPNNIGGVSILPLIFP